MRLFSSHPRGLLLLSSVSLSDRFSFYALQGMLVLFLTAATTSHGFGWSNAAALQLLGLYSALVYIAPIFGGWLADRQMGLRRAVLLGGLLMAAGHVAMAIPAIVPPLFTALHGWPVGEVLQAPGVVLGQLAPSPEVLAALDAALARAADGDARLATMQDTARSAYTLVSGSLYLALLLVVAGTGLFKSNISVMIGQLYEEGDARRESGFTLFWTAGNAGSFIANIIAGGVGEKYGWHYGFSIAAFGMFLGLAVYFFGLRTVLRDAGDDRPRRAGSRASQRGPLLPDEIARLRVIFVMSLFVVVFVAAFLQLYGLINLFTAQSTDRVVLGFEVPTLWLQSLNPLVIVLVAPFVSGLWLALAQRGADPSAPAKFAIALLLTALGFLCMVGAAATLEPGGKASILWVLAAVVLLSLAEIPIQPVGLALVSRLAPVRYASVVMGLWFLSSAAASWLAGEVGALADSYGALTVFMGVAIACIATAAAAWLMSRPLLRWMAAVPA